MNKEGGLNVKTGGSKLQILSSKVLQILCMLFFIITFWNGIFFFKQTYGINLTYMLTLFAILFMLIIISFLVNRYLTSNQFFVILFFIAFCVRFVWILNVNTPIVSDFLMMYQSAIDAAKGDFSFSENSYFSNWVYQLGFTMYEALMIKIFGEGTFVLKLLNVLFSAGTTVVVYKIAAKLFNDVCGRIAGSIYAIYIPSIVMSSVLTNQHLATFLFYLGFYVLINNHYSKKFIWAYVGILLSLGDIIRPLGSFILVAVGLFLFITQFLGQEKKQKISSIKNFIGIIVTFFLVHFIISQLFILMEVTKYPLENRDPLWKFVVGLNHETTGGYSAKDLEYVWKFPIGSERKVAEMQLIKERLADKQKLMVLFNDKFKSMWAGKDSSIYWSLGHIDQKQLINNIYIWERLIYICLMFFGIISLMKLVKDRSNASLLFVLLILGYVAVHFMIEIQTRYRYFIIPSFVIIQSYGVYSLFVYLNGCFHHLSRLNGQ